MDVYTQTSACRVMVPSTPLPFFWWHASIGRETDFGKDRNKQEDHELCANCTQEDYTSPPISHWVRCVVVLAFLCTIALILRLPRPQA